MATAREKESEERGRVEVGLVGQPCNGSARRRQIDSRAARASRKQVISLIRKHRVTLSMLFLNGVVQVEIN